MSLIRLDNVSKTFTGASNAAVKNCSFEVASGSFVVLLGPSGCGKTTLLKMINRLYDPSAGAISIDSEDIRDLDPTELRRQIGYVIQQVGLFPHMTVAQNVAVVPTLLDWTKDRITARVRELLALVELPPDEYCSRYPAQLSGGEQQRVGVARALAGDPKVVLMDEPFGAIDAITRTTLQDELLRLQRMVKKTVVFVTHDVEEALRLADKIVIMREGQLVQYDTPLAILTKPANDFVHNLVGADDIVRQLSLVRVAAAMHSLKPTSPDVSPSNSASDRTSPAQLSGGTQQIDCDDDLRHALSLLLQTGASALTVMDNHRPIGRLTLDDIRASAKA